MTKVAPTSADLACSTSSSCTCCFTVETLMDTSSKLSPKHAKEVVLALRTLNDDQTKQLFYHLDLPFQKLTNIEAKHSGGMLTIHCVHEWINFDLEASWGKIVAGLIHVGMKHLAKELAAQHHIETPPSDHLTSDPINPPVPTQDSDVKQSLVTSKSQPLTSVVSSTYPAKVTSESIPSISIQPVTPEVSFTHPVTESAPSIAVKAHIPVATSPPEQ